MKSAINTIAFRLLLVTCGTSPTSQAAQFLQIDSTRPLPIPGTNPLPATNSVMQNGDDHQYLNVASQIESILKAAEITPPPPSSAEIFVSPANFWASRSTNDPGDSDPNVVGGNSAASTFLGSYNFGLSYGDICIFANTNGSATPFLTVRTARIGTTTIDISSLGLTPDEIVAESGTGSAHHDDTGKNDRSVDSAPAKVTSIPEPSGWALLGGVGTLILLRRRTTR